MSLINPDNFRIATVECTRCNEKIENPTDEERRAFSAAHIHGNEILQAWFDKGGSL